MAKRKPKLDYVTEIVVLDGKGTTYCTLKFKRREPFPKAADLALRFMSIRPTTERVAFKTVRGAGRSFNARTLLSYLHDNHFSDYLEQLETKP